ncbi:mitochondrial metallopeptidase [Pseudohyphozyma bogoriensis]|nr:mitochondrial metallopeptidase [Pseudohyphozyma bogoriensis]
MAPGELTPGISAKEYEQRRKRLMDGLEDGAVVVIAGGKMKYMSGMIFYKFRQASNMWYLTGWQEPDSVLVLEKNSSSRGYKMTMFCPQKEANDELWHGPRSGREGAMEVFGADDACDISYLSTRLKSILSAPSTSFSSPPIYVDAPGVSTSSRVSTRFKARSFLDYLTPSADSEFDELKAVFEGRGGRTVKSAANEVEKLRLIKSDAEVKVMRRAADISSNAHAKVRISTITGK